MTTGVISFQMKKSSRVVNLVSTDADYLDRPDPQGVKGRFGTFAAKVWKVVYNYMAEGK